MRRKGNRNFGVWNPPTGVDALKYSERINFELIAKLNNLQTGKEKGIKQSFGISLPNFKSPNTSSITYLNNNNLKTFTKMIQQGWGG